MARIAGIDLPKKKRGVIGLTYIYGIGRSSAASILDKAVNAHHLLGAALGQGKKHVCSSTKVRSSTKESLEHMRKT